MSLRYTKEAVEEEAERGEGDYVSETRSTTTLLNEASIVESSKSVQKGLFTTMVQMKDSKKAVVSTMWNAMRHLYLLTALPP